MPKRTENTKEKKPSRALAAMLIVIGAAGFAALSYIITVSGSVSWDDPVREWFYSVRSPGLTTLMEGITNVGSWTTIALVVLLLLIYPATRNDLGFPALGAALLTQAIKFMIKNLVDRPRPDASLFLVPESGFSFPSGHAFTSLAVYGIIFIFALCYLEKNGKRTALLIASGILAIAIGISRIYLGVHFPSDVAAGWCGAMFVCGFIMLVHPAVRDRLPDRS